MTEKFKSMFNIRSAQSINITVRICSITGAIFEETFPMNQITFGHVKYLAMQSLLDHSQMEKAENYKLISMGSKRTIDDNKTLKEERAENGDEYFLARKLSNESVGVEQTSDANSVDEDLIQLRTKDLPRPANVSPQPHHLTRRTEFRTDLTRILLGLIEASQKLLWYRSDAEQIFQQAERILSQSSQLSNAVEINPTHIRQLIDIGFTEQQARFALKRTKSDLNAAMEFLLTDPKIEDENENEKENSTAIYSHQGPFITFRQFRQKYFQPNSTTVQSLQDMGFDREEIICALRVCRNNQNLACDYLIGDRQQQQTITDTNNEQDADLNSNLYKALIENPVIQRAINNPKTFFVLLFLYENPTSLETYINEPEIAHLLLEVSRIYYSERYQMDRLNSNQSDQQIEILTDNESDGE